LWGKSVCEQRKKGHIAQPPKMATVRHPTPWPILLIIPPKIMLSKSHGTKISARTPRRNMVMRRGVVAMVEFCMRALLHNECAVAIFLEGDATIIRLDSRGSSWISLSLFFV
jgi:hypothetical protein